MLPVDGYFRHSSTLISTPSPGTSGTVMYPSVTSEEKNDGNQGRIKVNRGKSREKQGKSKEKAGKSKVKARKKQGKAR